MYSASNAFHEAVMNNAHQIALLIFADAVFTNEDIVITNGIRFNDYFNADENLSIGQALSNELSFSLLNDEKLLNGYTFGDFTATIGVEIGNTAVPQRGMVQAESASHTYVSYYKAPFLKRDDVALAEQPTKRVTCILIYNGIVYCGLEDGTVKAYKDSDGTVQSVTVNDFMKNQFSKWAGKGIYYDKGNRSLKIWERYKLRTYEFVPLGNFTAKRPNVPVVNVINFNCYDFMQKFETDMPSSAALNITYPATIGTLFEKMCTYVGVSYRTSTFINSTAVINAKPDAFDSATMREVLQWIAEAAASNAKFDRDGYLILDWVHDTAQEIDENGYSKFNPYWYQTKKVSKLYNQSSDGEYSETCGTGDEGYLIQDNPLLEGVS